MVAHQLRVDLETHTSEGLGHHHDIITRLKGRTSKGHSLPARGEHLLTLVRTSNDWHQHLLDLFYCKGEFELSSCSVPGRDVDYGTPADSRYLVGMYRMRK